jgi:uncharacterized protein YbaP (TraB family)
MGDRIAAAAPVGPRTPARARRRALLASAWFALAGPVLAASLPNDGEASSARRSIGPGPAEVVVPGPAALGTSPPPAASSDPSPAFAASVPGDGGCPPEPVPITAPELSDGLRDATDSGFLWRITRAGRTSYLYGTIHVAERGWVPPGPRVIAAMRASEQVALELDPTDPEIAARTMSLFARKPGASDLPADLQARLQARARASCIQPQIAATVRPELLAVQLEIMVGRRLGLQPAYGIDLFIAGMAHGAGKPLRSLETPESQVALLISDDPKETKRRVEEALDEIDSGDAVRVLKRMSGDWRQGDLADLERYRSWCDCERTPEQRDFLRRVVDERNPGMADQVARWHADGHTLFVAVGALHLIGPHGVPALLRERGFTVERVELARAR